MKSGRPGQIVAAVLMPHAPILIPELGGERGKEAELTTNSMWRVARDVIAGEPDAIVLISPHSPRRPGEFGIWTHLKLVGDMAQFGRPDIQVELPNSRPFVTALTGQMSQAELQTWSINMASLDHGAFVPLYFFHRSGWTGPTTVIGLNYPGEGEWRRLGECIRSTAVQAGLRIAIVASGDMSHRLKPGVPAGYDPKAKDFDAEFVRLVGRGDYASLEHIDAGLQERAAEDVVDSTLIAAYATGMDAHGHEVLSYQGPFGVGYCVAKLFLAKDEQKSPEAILPTIARNAVERRFRNGATRSVGGDSPFAHRRAGVFVTIRTRDGRLRGCRGTIIPQSPNVLEETQAVAVSSAFNDGRFEPVSEDELDNLRFEVSVLNPAEPVSSKRDLDPHRYGIIVSTADGRRGLMLPAVEGLDTVDEQIEATCRKAYIEPDEPIVLERFTVQKFAEN